SPALACIFSAAYFGIGSFREKKYYLIEVPEIWRSYLGLMLVSALLLFRSLIDLGLERKQEHRTNLTTGGMIWLASVMMLVLTLKAFLPGWRGIPQPQNPSYSVEFLTTLVASPDIVNSLTMCSHAVIALHLFLIGWLHFKNGSLGAAAALLYLLMPYTAMLALNTSQTFASLFIVLAVCWYRYPMLAGVFLAIGTALSFFPACLASVKA
ncbi:MAG TPA: hypothetical protein PKA06_14325, partial [Gemmatales bacterium]|nr:hypothetical protein [Gemmatales bacterium]